MKVLSENVSRILKTLPDQPGVYQFINAEGEILYIGKAKSLKKRVSSYFIGQGKLHGKTGALVQRIYDIRLTVTANAMEALLLESNLIKQYQPRYNIMLKDDKSYPWLVIKNERFPRIFYTRKVIRDGSEYFGPFPSGNMLFALLDTIKQLYPRRTCLLNLSEQNIKSGKFRLCLEYHIGNCKGPCAGLQSEEEYNKMVQSVREICRGNIGKITRKIKEEMAEAAENLDFEKANEYKLKLEALEGYQGKSTVVSAAVTNVDVICISSDDNLAFVNYMRVVNGCVIQSYTGELKKVLEETDGEILLTTIPQLRSRFQSNNQEVITNVEVDEEIVQVKTIVPKRGDKLKLMQLSVENAEQYRKNKIAQLALVDPERHVNRILERMQQDLRMTEKPKRIECFDNSNIQGTNAVSAMTVFINGKPAKNEYRHYNIRTVEGPNDFASMAEVVYRRYSRVLKENLPLPQLIVIDGGKGQLSVVYDTLHQLGLSDKVGVIGIAKKLEEIYFPFDSVPLYLDKRSETLKIIQQIRDEAHRFGITHHRKRRNASSLKTELTDIEGISNKTAEKLLIRFRSVKGVSEATFDELKQLIGESKATNIMSYFGKGTSTSDLVI